jgi:ribonucleotide monophosphatase NagD (HAD superfamily)
MAAHIPDETLWPVDYTQTIFTDLDGTLMTHPGTQQGMLDQTDPLPGVVAKMKEWKEKGATIIITTGRPEWTRERTEQQLKAAGIVYDRLIMGLSSGKRHLINDTKPGFMSDTAEAHILPRNTGFAVDFLPI